MSHRKRNHHTLAHGYNPNPFREQVLKPNQSDLKTPEFRSESMSVPKSSSTTKQVEKKATDKQMSLAAYENNKALEGYEIDQELSSPDRTVYVDPNSKHVTIAFRGTDLHHASNRWRDIGADAAVFFGMEGWNHRFTHQVEATKKIIDKYGKDNVSLTGHSLGGSIGMYVSSKLGVKANVFNAGVSPADISRQRGANKLLKENYELVDTNIKFGDPISSFGTALPNSKKHVKAKPLIHSITSFATDTSNTVKSSAARIAGEAATGLELPAVVDTALTLQTAKQYGSKLVHDLGNLHSLNGWA